MVGLVDDGIAAYLWPGRTHPSLLIHALQVDVQLEQCAPRRVMPGPVRRRVLPNWQQEHWL